MYTQKKSWIDEVHPTIRLILTIIIICILAVCYSIKTLLAGFLLSVLTIHFAKIGYKTVIKKLGSLLLFLALIWIFLCFFEKNKIETVFGYLSLGLFMSIQLTLKSISIYIIFISFISTMDITTLGFALRCLRIQKKMTSLIIITYRYIYLIEKEYKKILKTVKVRSFVAKNNIHTYKTFSYIIGTIFVRSYERSKKVQYALLCRNFDGYFPNKKKYIKNLENMLFIINALLGILILVVIELYV